MKKILILWLYTLLVSPGFSQDKVEFYIKEIRKEFNLIQNGLKDFEKIQYTLPDKLTDYTTNINFTGYFKDGSQKLLIAEMNWGSVFQKHSYYFKGGDIFFVFEEKSAYGEETQERFYFNNDTLIRALKKKRNSSDSLNFFEIPNETHPEFGKNKNQSAFDYRKATGLNNLFLDNYPGYDDFQVKKYMDYINNERDIILNNISGYKVKNASYQSEYYWQNADFTGYVDEQNNLRLLTFSLSDEGYETNYQFFYNNGEVFYIFRDNIFEPEDELSQEQIFIYNGKVLEVHTKKKTLDDNTPFEDIEIIITKNYDSEFFRFKPKWAKDTFFSYQNKDEN